MTHTLFYVAGGALVVIALVIAFVGMRSDNFPSTGVMRLGIAFAAVVVVATLYGAVILAADEKAEREHNEAAAAVVDEDAAQGDTESAEGGGEASTGGQDGESGGAAGDKSGSGGGGGADGAQVFVEAGCGSCHALAALGSEAQGTVGPDLGTALAGKDEEFIRTSIVDPDAEVTEGFPGGTMPATYEEQLGSEKIDALVSYLAQQAGK